MWTTCFKSLIQLDKKEQELVKTAKITYARPSTLSGILTNYKKIAQDNKGKSNKEGYSKGCGRCGLCGNIKGFENMIKNTDHIKTKEGKIFKLKQELNCKDYGIYVAQCHICEETYTGQTVTSFSKRWTSHRFTWNKIINNKLRKTEKYKENDEQALYQHYQENHPEEFQRLKNKLSNAYKIILIERPPKHKLDTAENFWINKLKSKINIIRPQIIM
jgi:ribosomal protein S2